MHGHYAENETETTLLQYQANQLLHDAKQKDERKTVVTCKIKHLQKCCKMF